MSAPFRQAAWSLGLGGLLTLAAMLAAAFYLSPLAAIGPPLLFAGFLLYAMGCLPP